MNEEATLRLMVGLPQKSRTRTVELKSLTRWIDLATIMKVVQYPDSSARLWLEFQGSSSLIDPDWPISRTAGGLTETWWAV